MEVSDKNPEDCRPYFQYPWHADGPPAEQKEENKGEAEQIEGKKEEVEDIEKIHDVWCQYMNYVQNDISGKWNMTVYEAQLLVIERVQYSTTTRPYVSKIS